MVFWVSSGKTTRTRPALSRLLGASSDNGPQLRKIVGFTNVLSLTHADFMPPACLSLYLLSNFGIRGRHPGECSSQRTWYSLWVDSRTDLWRSLCRNRQPGEQKSFKGSKSASVHGAGVSKPMEGTATKFLQVFK